MLASEPDFTVVTFSPVNPVWERTWSMFLDALIAGGWDPLYGSQLATDLRAAGLVDVHAHADARVGPGGSYPLLAMTIERMRERMVALGADPDEIEEALRLFGDPASTITAPTACVARGQRPLRPSDAEAVVDRA